jgi:hypothetical protein
MEATLKAKALGVAVKSSLPETPSERIMPGWDPRTRGDK